MSESVRGLLETALEVLRFRQHVHYSKMHGQLKKCSIQFVVDSERFGFKSLGYQMVVVDECMEPGMRLEASRLTLLDLLDDRLSLVEAAKKGKLLLKGSTGSLVRLDSALSIFFRGLYKCPESSALLAELRR